VQVIIQYHLLKGLFDFPLYDFVQDKPRVLGISHDQPLINAFSLMIHNQIHAVPVIDEVGQIVSTVTENSFKGLYKNSLRMLNQPPPLKTKEDCLVCFVVQTVGDAVEKMLENRAHHIWIISDSNVIEGVLTWTDVMQLFVSKQY
jgi:CBS-domain-containing membrane protein